MFDLDTHSAVHASHSHTSGGHEVSAFPPKVINFAAENNSYRLICNSGNIEGCKAHCKKQFPGFDKALAADECTKAVVEAYGGGLFGKTACFPMNSVVTRRGDGIIPLCKLRVGDEILAPSSEGVFFDSVVGFLHWDETSKVSFVSLRFGNGRLTIHPDHLVPVRDDKQENRTIRASEVREGFSLESLWIDGSLGCTSVTEVETIEAIGLCCPVTKSGMIIVDSVSCSCYSVPRGIVPFQIGHGMCHALMAPLRLSYELSRSKLQNEKPSHGINPYAKLLMSAATGVIFA
jgi:hypothetical protein